MQIRFDRIPGGHDNEARFIEAETDDGTGVKLAWKVLSLRAHYRIKIQKGCGDDIYRHCKRI
jgi:hypothetical protein